MPHSAAALAVIAAAAAGTAAASDAPFSAPVEGTAGKTADYAHFAEMLASVMMLREGGVDKAMEAVPMLHDTTQAYIKTMSLAEKHPDWFAKNGTKAGDWAGLKDGDLDLLKTIKEANATEKEDPVHKLGDKIQAKLGAFEDKNKPEKTWEMEKMEKFEKMLPQVRGARGERRGRREDGRRLRARAGVVASSSRPLPRHATPPPPRTALLPPFAPA